MQFNYVAVTKVGLEKKGSIEAPSQDAAISGLQRRELIVISVSESKQTNWLEMDITVFERVAVKDVVILSRQIATLFEAQVSALKAFSMLATEVENQVLSKKLVEVSNDIKGGMSISDALSKHPVAFSDFYVNMIRAGEESGKLSEVFTYLADYLDRQYEMTSKARSAFMYPIFVMTVFVGVMVLLLTMVVPTLSGIIRDSGQDVPFYTVAVMNTSDFLVNYGIAFFIIIVILITGLWYLGRTGTISLSRFALSIPFVGSLYQKLYLSRIADNLNTMLSSGVPMIRAVEVTANVVDNETYKTLLTNVIEDIRGGSSLSDALSGYEEMPRIMVVMTKVGEETGELANILKVMAKFYEREVKNAVEGLISLIEPLMIVMLGLGVGIVLASVLMPIYDIAGSIA
jgi:type IV pilus assembly protein PilC